MSEHVDKKPRISSQDTDSDDKLSQEISELKAKIASAEASLSSAEAFNGVTVSDLPAYIVSLHTHAGALVLQQTSLRLQMKSASAFPHFATAAEVYTHIRSITAQAGDFTVRNFVCVIDKMSPPDAAVVETELFPRGAIEFYTKKNMGWEYTDEETAMWLLPERGGEQGDYRDGMPEKIANVIDCLRTEPRSKRAIIPIPFTTDGSKTVDWHNQGQTKCCRELHLYIEDGKLKCTGILRMQNASIFPKNIHFFATLIDHVARELGLEVGEYTHWITNLCHDRSAICC